jgi:RNA polymerase sigma-70 factor, ECF subfamily
VAVPGKLKRDVPMTDKTKFERQAMVHMGASYNLAYSLLRQRSDAEDAVQDAYVRAYRAFNQLRGDDIKPWLLTIVRNVCYRRLQERNRARNVISLDEALVAQSGG